jgi:Zn-dependent M28 family amino/carboxypeptidase
MLKPIIFLFVCFPVLVVIVIGFLLIYFLKMPGKSYRGNLPEPSNEVRQLSRELEGHVVKLSGEIGERNWLKPANLNKAAEYIEQQFEASGFKPKTQEYQLDKRSYRNIIAEQPGISKPDEIIVLGAHYDSVVGCPAANDNGTGVASLLALARMIKAERLSRTVRFVAFPNEESPFFGSDAMGSFQYARNCRRNNERIKAMLSLETMGYYSDDRHSQSYPSILRWIYPDTGNFIAFVGTLSNRDLVHRCVDLFRKHAEFPCEGGSAPSFLPGVDWSDHYSFSAFGYPAVMVTDTAPYRYPYYHTAQDTAEHVDFARLALVTQGLFEVVRDLGR